MEKVSVETKPTLGIGKVILTVYYKGTVLFSEIVAEGDAQKISERIVRSIP